MSATTDSEMVIKYDPENKPGISNLINIYVSLIDMSVEDVEKKYIGQNYGTFKKDVADIVVNELTIIQNKYNDIINSDILDNILDEGREFARELAKNKFNDMKEKMGLSRKC